MAVSLARFVTNYNFDGVDIDFQDGRALLQGTAEQWIVDFTKKLRSLLPDTLLVHSVNAGYFTGQPTFRNGGYLNVHSEVGNLIDFYNIKYYRQGSSTYNSYQTLFTRSTGWASKTSVN